MGKIESNELNDGVLLKEKEKKKEKNSLQKRSVFCHLLLKKNTRKNMFLSQLNCSIK